VQNISKWNRKYTINTDNSMLLESGRTEGSTKGFIPTKLPKFDLTNDAEYVTNLVNVNIWL